MTYGSILRGVSTSLEDPAELGVNGIFPLRTDVEGVTRAGAGEVLDVLLILGRLRPTGKGPEEIE